ncbi:MAG TPA: glycoside hydrolase family 57 protein [Terriglobia bacterium]|nr:glycoside hydrolase family 57 protein [Terriglobia bacterium]
MSTTYLMLLWHQHQPFYKDLVEERYTMPWVRLHALKDYFGMAAELRAFPQVHVTINLVPSLITQLQDYASGAAHEESFDLAFKPVVDMTESERERLLHYAFQLNHENLLYRYPRFRELYEKAKPWELGSRLAGAFSDGELRDLQVLSQLAWFDELWLESDAEIRRLVAKGRGFSQDDKALVRRKELQLIHAVLEEHRVAQDEGRVEISTSPFYHPILPLLCDNAVALQSHPAVPLPYQRFRHPEDAVAQLRAARELYRQVFGREPRGFWPSEGSLSEEVLRLAVQEGFQWTASDEGVLSRSIGVSLRRRGDGTMEGGNELYRPHILETESGPIGLFFRDHEISDLIGFVYSSADPIKAAGALLDRIRQAGRSTGSHPAVVSIILDGENCWEYYRQNGRPFLRAFYRLVASDPEIRAVTASEALQVAEHGRISHLVPGSWINANFDVWIGAEEDNRAWDLLSDAREFFAANASRPGLDPEKVRLAQEELYVAEGSDWNWWYGPEHSTENDEEFDRLYRKHLSNIYGLLGASPPDELAVPLKRPHGQPLNVAPAGEVEPVIDGVVSNYFEWLGAGVYRPAVRSDAMHGPPSALDMVYYGYGQTAFYLRLDLNREAALAHPDFEIRITVEGKRAVHVAAHTAAGKLLSSENWVEAPASKGKDAGAGVALALDRVFELRVDFEALEVESGGQLSFQVSVWSGAVPLQVVPQDGWLTVTAVEQEIGW